jgi:signal transduction histidine kinase
MRGSCRQERSSGSSRPFEQGGADRSGVGLGLSLSRHGVQACGGSLYVRDLPGKGCIFTIDLPRKV